MKIIYNSTKRHPSFSERISQVYYPSGNLLLSIIWANEMMAHKKRGYTNFSIGKSYLDTDSKEELIYLYHGGYDNVCHTPIIVYVFEKLMTWLLFVRSLHV